jgi:hypothetical protein
MLTGRHSPGGVSVDGKPRIFLVMTLHGATDASSTSQEFNGVTHEFFGMGAVVPPGKQTEEYAADALGEAFRSK